MDSKTLTFSLLFRAGSQNFYLLPIDQGLRLWIRKHSGSFSRLHINFSVNYLIRSAKESTFALFRQKGSGLKEEH